MKYRIYDINDKRIMVSFISVYQSVKDYCVQIVGSTKQTRARIYPDNRICAPYAQDAGLKEDECITAVGLFLREEHDEYLKWKEQFERDCGHNTDTGKGGEL